MATRTIFWRVFWKEYRLQRPLWIAMAVLTTLLMLMIVGFSFDPRTERTQFLFLVAVTFPALYAMGCGAVSFSGEHEAETYEFQRMLPVRVKWVFFGKIALAISSTIALFILMWLLAALLNGWELPDSAKQGVMYGNFGFMGLEVFCWTVLFSLLTKRVIVAAMLGIAAASISVSWMVAMIAPRPSPEIEMYWDVIVWRVMGVVLVASVDVWLAMRWFQDKNIHRRHEGGLFRNRWRVGLGRSSAGAFSDRMLAPSRMAILGRLLWQQGRQSL
jgi:ABC-type transport system involved in multi-copper enzyme maturation permease subunit